MSELKIAICDDERIEQLLLSKFLMKYVPDAQLYCFPDGKSLLADFNAGQYQAVFMDIYMRDMNGITVVQEIRRIDPAVPVAFTTSSTDHQSDSRMVRATAYLTKPLKEEEVRQFLQTVQEVAQRPKAPGVMLMVSGQKMDIPLDQILYLEKKLFAGTSVYLKDGSVCKCDRMPELPEKAFCRCSSAFMVPLPAIRQVDASEMKIDLSGGTKISIQKTYLRSVMDAYDRYIFDQMRGQS